MANRSLFESPSVSKGEEPPIHKSHFNFIQKIGEGAFGEVWRVKHKETNELYAIKKVPKEKVMKILTQFRRELVLMYSLEHPYIAKLHNHFEDKTHFYLIMEYAEGGNLFGKLKRHRQFMEREAAQYFREAVLAVEYLHSHDPPIIHRDIKPENILLDANSSVKLTDFGWSNFFKEGQRKTICGTLEYLPPEMLDGSPHNTSVDVWCLGVLLFEMLVGYTPFKAQNKRNLIHNISKNKPPFPLSFPQDAKDLVLAMLNKDSQERINLTQVKNHKWFKETPFIREVPEQEFQVSIPLPDYKDPEEVEVRNYKVMNPKSKPSLTQDTTRPDSDVFELSSSEDSLALSEDEDDYPAESCRTSISLMKTTIVTEAQKNSDAKEDIDQLNSKLETLNYDISDLETTINAKTKEAKTLEKKIKQLYSEISDVNLYEESLGLDESSSINSNLQTLKRDLMDKKSQFSIVKNKYEYTKKVFSETCKTIKNKEGELDLLRQTLSNLKDSQRQSINSLQQHFEGVKLKEWVLKSRLNHGSLSRALSGEDNSIGKQIIESIKATQDSDLQESLKLKLNRQQEQLETAQEKVLELQVEQEHQKAQVQHNLRQLKDQKANELNQKAQSLALEKKALKDKALEGLKLQIKKAREDEHEFLVDLQEFNLAHQKFKVSFT